LAVVNRVVDPDGTGNYTSLSAWNGAEQTDLVTATDTHDVTNISSSGTADTTPVTVTGWTTNGTYFITIKNGSNHLGVWDAAIARLLVNSATTALILSQDYTVITGLQIENQLRRCSQITATECLIEKCIIRADTTYTSGVGIQITGSGTTTYVKNNFVYGYGTNFLRTGISVDNGTAYLYNNTVVDVFFEGFFCTGDSTVIISNNVVFNATTACYNIDGAVSGNNNGYNAGADPASNGIDYSGDAGTDLFLDYGNDDFHVKDALSSLYQVGIDLRSDVNLPVTEDIDGDTRPAAPCIGGDELIAGGPTEVDCVDSIDFDDSASDNVNSFSISSDSMNLSDTSENKANTLAGSVDSMNLSDTSVNQANVQSGSVDSMIFSDTSSIVSILQAACIDSIELNDNSTRVLIALAECIDSIDLTDNSSSDTIYNAICSDGISLSDVISKIQELQAIAIDDISFSDIATAVGGETTGLVKVSFTTKNATVVFTVKQASIVSTVKQANITITGRNE